MKNTVLVAVTGIALGFAIAWLVKPQEIVTTDTKASAAMQAPASTETKESRITTRATSTTPREESSAPKASSNVIESDSPEFMKMIEKQQKAKFDARITRLVKELNLTPAQEAELRKLWKKKAEGIAALIQGEEGMESAEEIASVMTGSGIEDTLEPLLTDEQKEALAELQQRELDNRVESRALKGLAKLSFLDLRPEQKDAMMELLYEQAEEKEKSPGAESAVMGMVTGSLGLDIDIDDLGLEEIIGEQIEEGDEPANPADFMARLQENQQRRIDEKVAALEPVLDDDQLERYRESLESKQGGILGHFLGGFDHDTLHIEPNLPETTD